LVCLAINHFTRILKIKKNYKELSKIMESCTDLELVIYRFTIANGMVEFEDVQTGEKHIRNNLEVFDMITMELVYREIL
jgi:hypothetical protein